MATHRVSIIVPPVLLLLGLAAFGCSGGNASSNEAPTASSAAGTPAAAQKPRTSIIVKLDAWPRSVHILKDGKRILVNHGGQSEPYRLWDVEKQEMIAKFAGPTDGTSPCANICFANEIALILKPRHRLAFVDCASGKQLAIDDKDFSAYEPHAFRFSSNGDIVCADNGKKNIRVFDTKTGKVVGDIDNGDDIYEISGLFDNDSKIACSSPHGTVKVWDIKNKKLVTKLNGVTRDDAINLEVSRDGKWLAVSSWNEPVNIYDMSNWKQTRELQGNVPIWGHFAFISGTSCIAISTDNGANIFDVKSGDLKLALMGHPYVVRAVAGSPDGKTLVTISSAPNDQQIINIWDLPELN